MFGTNPTQHITEYLSRPDLGEPFYFSIWLDQGVIWVAILVFLFLCWPGMVPNQRQLSVVVSDWRSYLGSLFSTFSLWDLVFWLVACVHAIGFTFHLCLIVLFGEFQ